MMPLDRMPDSWHRHFDSARTRRTKRLLRPRGDLNGGGSMSAMDVPVPKPAPPVGAAAGRVTAKTGTRVVSPATRRSACRGGSIPLCNVFADAYPNAEIILIGVEEPRALIHAPNESVDPCEIAGMALAEAVFRQRYA
jgi:hypothetical protein